jgi:hypothetical protein
MRQTDYLQQQIQDGVHAWYVRNQEHTFDLLLHDLNIDESLIQHELNGLLVPVIQQMISQGHLRERARQYLEQFYYSKSTLNILKIEV